MKFEMNGFEELGKRLNEMEKGAKELGETKEVSFSELFIDSFMSKYTKYENLEEFFGNSQFDISSNESFEKMDKTELDKYITENSKFNSWQEMLDKAGEEFAYRKLGF